MSRYHFTTADGVIKADHVGIEFASAQEAKAEAIRFAGEWLRDEPQAFEQDGRFELVVTNDEGMVMWIVTSQLTNGPGHPAAQ